MKKTFNENKYLIVLWILTLGALIINFAHYGNLIVDCGREAYYPQEILNGKILYKDLFMIYTPFSYLFNAFLYKLFGINLSTLYFAGSIAAFLIITLFYLICRRFFDEKLSFSLSFLSVVIGILNYTLFNYVFPYSFGMTYGLLAFLASVLFLIKFSDSKNINYFYLSSFFAGLSIMNKYEFLPYLFVIILVMIREKLNITEIFISFFTFLLIPEFSLFYLFFQGLSLHDLKEAGSAVIAMSKTQTLKYSYMHSGTFYNIKTFPMLLKNFIIAIIPILIFIFPNKIAKLKNKAVTMICSYTCIIISLFIVYMTAPTPEYFTFLPLLVVILLIINIKEIFKNSAVLIVVLSAVLFSFKVFWGAVTITYGAFYIPFLLIAVIILVHKKIPNLAFYILIFAIILGEVYFSVNMQKEIKLQTEKGTFYTFEAYDQTNAFIDYIKNNTKKNDKVLILPEGMLLNFLTDRKTDNFYNSLIPLYVESFGEKRIIDHFEKSMPEYIVLTSWKTSDYYFSYICKDYALDFCRFVKKNYFEKATIIGKFNYLIFKLKKSS